jgi:hypothetical protein
VAGRRSLVIAASAGGGSLRGLAESKESLP